MSTEKKHMSHILGRYMGHDHEFDWQDVEFCLRELVGLNILPHRTTIARFLSSKVKDGTIKITREKSGQSSRKYKLEVRNGQVING